MKRTVFKALAIILCVTFLCSTISMALSTPSANDLDNRVSLVSGDGKLLEFDMYTAPDGSIIMNYYYDGILKCSYNLTSHADEIIATKSSGESYSVCRAPVEGTQLSVHTAENTSNTTAVTNTTQNLGVIYYNTAGPYTTPHNVISITTVNAQMDTHRITSSAGEYAADVTAAIASGILAGLAGVLASPTVIVAAIAAAILSEMIASAGGDIVNEAITVALSDSYDCVTLTKRLTAKFYGWTINGTWSHNYSCGVKYVSYDGESFSEYYPFGEYHQYNWATTGFANLAWKDTAEQNSGYGFPGVLRIIENDPSN